MASATRTGPSARKRIRKPETFEMSGRLGWVPVAKLFSDPAYQRPVDVDRVRAMALNFNPDAVGAICVSKRSRDSYAVFDGFHRVSLFKLMNWEDQQIPAVIYDGLTPQQEAELFIEVNKERTKPKPLALFKARVASGDRDAVDLANVLTTLGLSFESYSAVKGGIRAIDTIQRVQDSCGLGTVRRTLTAMTKAWNDDADALNGEVFKGVALLLQHYETKVDLNNLAHKLSDHSPASVRIRAKQMREIMPEWQSSSCVAAVLVTIYNYRLRTDSRLPAWEGQTFPRKNMSRSVKREAA